MDQPEAKKLYEGAMKGMFEALNDPYSTFLDESSMSFFSDLASGQFGGIGVVITKSISVQPRAACVCSACAACVTEMLGKLEGMNSSEPSLSVGMNSTPSRVAGTAATASVSTASAIVVRFQRITVAITGR